ncbi:Malate dehydrogenase, mitochondrial [Smittium culicis]|uniref:Malate dehydrogenase n=1 Tax=Smittium culicis TaxID=133412 RepID=A0A1R1XEH7_9FUNG|nr:Malate dehydrogenase, mitochondrial [Smittium culicis]
MNFTRFALRSNIARGFATSAANNGAKVAVLGAAGGIGQPLSLLLKNNPLVEKLSLYDVANCPGVASDLSHINTTCFVQGFGAENDGLRKALEGAEHVIIPAGVPRKPGMTRDDLFGTNASIVRELTTACAEVCPDANIMIISNPVNSMLPIAAQVYKNAGKFNAKRLIGVTTLDLVRASRFVYEKIGKEKFVPVIGGHAGTTIVPLYSQIEELQLGAEELAALVHRTQFGGDEVVQAKAGKGSATLSMAYAGARFADSMMRAANGEDVTECAFVSSELFASSNVHYFASSVKLGSEGIKEIIPVPSNITEIEKKMIADALPQLEAAANKGINFVNPK